MEQFLGMMMGGIVAVYKAVAFIRLLSVIETAAVVVILVLVTIMFVRSLRKGG